MSTSKERNLVLPLQIMAGAVLAYLVTVHSLGSYLAQSAPQAALRLNGSQPVALTLLAEREMPNLIGSQTSPPAADGAEPSRLEGFARLPKLDLKGDSASTSPGQPETPAASPELKQSIAGWLEKAVLANPLAAQSLGLLGGVALGGGDDARANTLMLAASARSAHVPLANYWLMRTNYDTNHYAEALVHADRLLRATPANAAIAGPFLGRIADAAPEDTAAALAKNPPWRPLFFAYLKGNIRDPRTPLNLLLKLKDTATPPTAREFGPYVSLLMENGYFDLAYGAWLQSLTPEQLTRAGFIYNGGFDYAPSLYPFPFEWSLVAAPAVLLDTVRMPDGNNALMLKFGPGRTSYRPVSQTAMLMPGDYVLSARIRGDVKSRRGFRWTVQCSGKTPTKLGESDEINGPNPDWKVVQVNFSVPTEGCRAQQVKFILDARSTSETLVSGSLFLDDVSILRQGEHVQQR